MDGMEISQKFCFREWELNQPTAYGSLLFCCHMWFLEDALGQGVRILDAACGKGCFAVESAYAGANVSMLDIQRKKLELAELNMTASGFRDARRFTYINESVTNMKSLPDNSYDVAILYGAALDSHSTAVKALSELNRVLKIGGALYLSVASRFGMLRACASYDGVNPVDFWADAGRIDALKTPDEPDISDIQYFKKRLYSSKEVAALLGETGFGDIKLGCAPALNTGLRSNVEKVYEDDDAWKSLLNAEHNAYDDPALADGGEFILAKGISL